MPADSLAAMLKSVQSQISKLLRPRDERRSLQRRTRHGIYRKSAFSNWPLALTPQNVLQIRPPQVRDLHAALIPKRLRMPRSTQKLAPKPTTYHQQDFQPLGNRFSQHNRIDPTILRHLLDLRNVSRVAGKHDTGSRPLQTEQTAPEARQTRDSRARLPPWETSFPPTPRPSRHLSSHAPESTKLPLNQFDDRLLQRSFLSRSSSGGYPHSAHRISLAYSETRTHSPHR